MSRRRLTVRQWVGWTGFGLVFLFVAALAVWRGDILQAGLDPQVPFQTYDPPPAPDYGQRRSWALFEARTPDSGDAAVFFVHSTTYDGGAEWNGPIGDREADAYLRRVVLPNYAGPFARSGAVSAPLYRQASLYTRLTLRDDAREARAFAFDDVHEAFLAWLARHPSGPIILAGVEQGGELVDRLIREDIAPRPDLRDRLVAAYLMDTVIAEANLPATIQPCRSRRQTGCIVAWSQVDEGNDGAARRRLRRALVWNDAGALVELADRAAVCVNPVLGAQDAAVCVNPVLGAQDGAAVSARHHLGAASATGLEWGVRPPPIDRLIATQCRDGLLRTSPPHGEAFRQGGSWADRRKARPYNLFYADIEADVHARLAVWEAAFGPGLSPPGPAPSASRTEPPAP